MNVTGPGDVKWQLIIYSLNVGSKYSHNLQWSFAKKISIKI